MKIFVFGGLTSAYILFNTIFSTAGAAIHCPSTLAPTEAISIDPIRILTSAEGRADAAEREFYQNFPRSSELAGEIKSVRQLFEQVFLSTNESSNTDRDYSKKVSHLLSRINDLENLIFILKQRNTSTTLKVPHLEPQWLIEEHMYDIDGIDPSVVRVSFSREVLESVFWSNDALMRRATDLIFRGLVRGRQHSTDKLGIVPFANDKSVFKIRITGNSVGAIRVAGFFIHNDLHLVTWSNESSHSNSQSQRMTEKVNRIRKKFLSTGRY